VTTYQLDAWSALGDRTRRTIFEQLAANRRIYQINPEGLTQLRADLDRFWSSALATYKAVVEQPDQEVS
jgi:hypothetical protein